MDFRHRFLKSQYQIQARLVGSQVNGSAAAIDLDPAERGALLPAARRRLGYDPTRTSLTGDSEQVTFGKFGGNLFRFETSYQRIPPASRSTISAS